MTTSLAASAPTGTTYDDVVYPSYPIFYASLDHLAMTAAVFGMSPAPVEKCRVLELGCADGGNIIPAAQLLPDSRFVGVDLSPKQIEMGRQTLKEAGIENVDLRAASIMDINPDWGKFDYIYCHGVYSWVPPEVREKILGICRENLSDQGVAFISYNTYPGWHMKQTVREMMVFHASRFQTPQDRVSQARALLEFLKKSVPESPDNAAYAAMLKHAVEQISQQPDYYLLHEYLEDINVPIYFYEFANAVNAAGLQYLGEAHVAMMSPSLFNSEIERTLRNIAPDIIHMEQYMDFIRNRAFRQSMVCLRSANLTRHLTGDLVRRCYITSDLKPTSAVDLATNAPNAFAGSTGMNVTCTDPLTKSVLLRLSELTPHYEQFDDLIRSGSARLPQHTRAAASTPESIAMLANNLIRLYAGHQVSLRLRDQDWARTVSDRPRTTPLARIQAVKRVRVASLAHDVPTMTLLEYALLPLLDGTRDRAALVDGLRGLVQQNILSLEGAPDPTTNPIDYDNVLGTAIDQALKSLLDRRLLSKD